MSQPKALFLADVMHNDPCSKAHHDAAAFELRRLHAENERLTAALASSCDEQRHELWESGGIAGCERARVAERQRDALLAEHQQTLALQQRSYEREIQLEVEAEREECAQIADAEASIEGIAQRIAAAIRARSK